MNGDIKCYKYKRHQIKVRGLCKKSTFVETRQTEYDWKKLICENRHDVDFPGLEMNLSADGDMSIDNQIECVPCIIQLIEIGFNRTIFRHQAKYNSRIGGRKKLQFVRLLGNDHA